MRRAGLVVNPAKFHDLRRLRTDVDAVFRSNGWAPPLWLETTIEDPGQGQARAALDEGVDLICPLGGDGTVRQVATAVRSSTTPMGLVPAGTGNLLARNLGLPVNRRYADAVRRAIHGTDRRIDVGVLQLDRTGDGRTIEEHVFLVMCGMGLEAEMLGGTPESLKARLGWVAYVLSGARHLRRPTVEMQLYTDGEGADPAPTTTVLIGNCGRLTGGVRLMPRALPDDGLLDAVVLSAGSLPQWGRLVVQVLRGGEGGSQVRHRPGREFDVTAVAPRTVQVDGDLIGEGRAMRVTVEPRSLVLRVP
ncbi:MULTISPECIES: diacylglycerol/lipid kinase family protein [Barrientosiimonas]|uniref:Sphingosine kinase n=1 Tax=Barrientosiimonas endolithica TaxID=1535208 RepID=A0ABN6YSP1_9MICO|nr:diacylglycerol kinase family protein [Barrientosiimonas endolithica]BDZ60156.1 sphingosine kinase [Barrientosiimonas endolithica]